MIGSESLALALCEALHDDPRILVLGEDVEDGTSMGLTRPIAGNAALRARLLGTPLVANTMIAYAGGLALGGRIPVVILPHADALVEGLSGLHEITGLAGRSDVPRTLPLLIIVPVGPGFGLGGDAVDVPENLLQSCEALRVLTAGQAADLSSLLEHAFSTLCDEGPTVLLIPRRALLDEIAVDQQLEPWDRLGVRVHQEGDEAVVYTWGPALASTLSALSGVRGRVKVVELLQLAPLPLDELVEHARPSGRVMISHAGYARGGVGAEIAAHLADAAILSLDAPIARVYGDKRGSDPARESLALPSESAISAAATRLTTF